MIKIPNDIIKWLLIALIGVIHSTSAQQENFSKSLKNDMVSFDYTWSDNRKTKRKVSFSLPIIQLNEQNHKKFIPSLAQQYTYIELLKAARNISPKEARVQIKRRGQDIHIEVTSNSNSLLNKWQHSMTQSQEKAFEQYLQENYYSRFRSHLGQQAIKPDHLRYIAENKTSLTPVAKAIYNVLPANSSKQAYVNLVLSWVQSIPYNELKSRITSNGAGYLPPLSVVANNQGDCDSKTALMASLVRSILPDVKMNMVFLPNHALLAIALSSRAKGQTLNINGLKYSLMEPTGPAKTPVGEIASSSASYIAGNMYSLEKVP